MFTTKRILAALLCAATFAVSFASCSGTSDTGSPADTTAGGDTETTAAETTTAPEYVAPETKYDGKTFVFSSWTTDAPNWIATSYSEASCPEPNGDLINDSFYERIKATEEATGVTVKSNLYKDSSVMRNTVMAGDHFADCVLGGGTSAATLALNKVLYDLNTIDTLDLSKSWWNQTANEQFSVGGKLYFAAGDISPFCVLASHCVFLNKGLTEDYGLENPYDAVREGTWTYDEMGKMAAVVANDVDGDGAMTKEDIFGLSSEAIGMATIGACGVYFSGKDKDDMPLLTIDAERAALAVEKIVPLFRNKDIALYSSDFASGYTNVFRQLIVQKFIEDEVLFVNNWLCVALELRSMDSDFGILPPPKLNEQQEDYMVYHSGSWTYYALVPVTIQDPDMVGHVVDALGHFGHDLSYTALVDTTITSKTLRDTDTEDMLQIIYDSRIFDAVTTYNWGGINSMLNSFISGNTTDFASTYAANEAKIVAAMNEAASTLAG